MATVIHDRPLIATALLKVDDSGGWSMPGFKGVAAIVEALSTSQSNEFVNAESLQAVEERVREAAPIMGVNPRGCAAGVANDIDMEADLPVMNRFEVVLDPSWATDLVLHSPSFANLAERLIALVRDVASDCGGLEPFWRIIVGFPGAASQKWYADDVDDKDLITCDIPLSHDESVGHMRFPLSSDGRPVDLADKCISEFEAKGCVVYSGDAVHYYTGVVESTPRVSLQLIMSKRGDPNDCIDFDIESSDDEPSDDEPSDDED
jgi:hypothetical protein